MKVKTTYLSPTNSRGSRIKVTTETGKTLTVAFNHAANNPDVYAIEQLLGQNIIATAETHKGNTWSWNVESA